MVRQLLLGIFLSLLRLQHGWHPASTKATLLVATRAAKQMNHKRAVSEARLIHPGQTLDSVDSTSGRTTGREAWRAPNLQPYAREILK